MKSATMLVHHVKGQPAASTYVREKGYVTCDTNLDPPCICSSGSQINILRSLSTLSGTFIFTKYQSLPPKTLFHL